MTKIYPEDKWFSLYIRQRDNWICNKCGTKFKPYEEGGDNRHLKGLHNAHNFGRGKRSTRWEPENCMALCYGCHRFIDKHAGAKRSLFIRKFGEEAYNRMEIKSNTSYRGWKKDRKAISKKYRNLFRSINE